MVTRAGGWVTDDGPWRLEGEVPTALNPQAGGGESEEAHQEAAEPPPPNEISWPQHRGRGVYELSDGSRISGRDEAQAAQADLDGGDD